MVTENKKEKNNNFVCYCGKQYKYSQGLSKHKKTCINVISNEVSDKELLLKLIKEQIELKNLILDISDKIKMKPV